MITLTIDGQQIQVPEGTTVLNAARKAGIHIPTLCDHPHLKPYGGCRLCMVEIEGFRTLQASCTIPATNNMVVRTTSEQIRKARKFVLTLIFSERNHFCPYCQVSGSDCELQNAAYGEGMTHWPLQPNWQPYPVDASHPYFILEHNRCILCRRCIRACAELVGANTLGVEERGAKTFVIADLNVPLGESSCVSCGMCVQVCPTGALIDRRSAYRGQNTTVDHQQTLCLGCSVGCGVDILTRDQQLIRIDGNWDAPVNQGVTCKVGRFYPAFDDRERLKTPLLRKNGSLQPVTWEEALEAAAEKIKTASGNGIAAVASTRLPLESLVIFRQLFAEHLRSAVVTSTDEGSRTAILSKWAEKLGKPFEGKIDQVHEAGAFLVMGADLVNEHEVLGFFIRRRFPEGIKLIVVDEDQNHLGDLAHCALIPQKKTQPALLKGLIAAVAKLGQNQVPFSGQPDEEVQKASSTCGVASDLLLEAAFQLTNSEKPIIIYDPAAINDDVMDLLITLSQTTGAAMISIKGGANALGAAQLDLDKTLKLNGQQVAFIAIGDEEPKERLIQQLEKCSSIIVQASYHSRLTAMADVVFPVVNWLEQDGHFINLDGRLQTAAKVLQPAETVWTNEAVLSALADKLGTSVESDWKNVISMRPSPVSIAI
ncbi:NADH dehydrogenase [Bellilinea caldifistulae]|uniref:molybdopterin-dependent oxidoreductase n=1 Tax=Bellilinea caldifistulae TaxID=360411 RepID=UPI0007820042|nr:molybdopterin-dependent oxidoreductase [Bellilinea caldifistulae]GAP11148.1 NADH dehydrogenase [Bellilinea caldifistulae]